MFCYVNCNLCSRDNTTLLEQGERPYQVVKCKGCGLIYLNPQPPIQSLYQHYDKEYYRPWLEEQEKERLRLWRRRARKVQIFKRNGKLLDVGCGCGVFLKEAEHNGFQVYGTEVSEFTVNYAKNTFGIDVFKGTLKDASFPDNFFDVITFWHVLEHTTDPLGNLIEARRILKPDGILVVAVPNVRNHIYRLAYLFVKLKHQKLFSLNDREVHLYHFSVNTLKKMMEKAGFKPLKFDMDKERVSAGKLILDTLAWIIYKTLGVNFGMALEVYAEKS